MKTTGGGAFGTTTYLRRRRQKRQAPITPSISAPPTPTLTPMMTRLSTLLTKLDTSSAMLDGVGTNDVGVPEVAKRSLAAVPKGIVVDTEESTEAGHVAVTPDATDVTRNLVVDVIVVVCSDAGQFTRPVDKHRTPVYVSTFSRVVVVRSCLLMTDELIDEAVDALVLAQTSAIVV